MRLLSRERNVRSLHRWFNPRRTGSIWNWQGYPRHLSSKTWHHNWRRHSRISWNQHQKKRRWNDPFDTATLDQTGNKGLETSWKCHHKINTSCFIKTIVAPLRFKALWWIISLLINDWKTELSWKGILSGHGFHCTLIRQVLWISKSWAWWWIWIGGFRRCRLCWKLGPKGIRGQRYCSIQTWIYHQICRMPHPLEVTIPKWSGTLFDWIGMHRAVVCAARCDPHHELVQGNDACWNANLPHRRYLNTKRVPRQSCPGVNNLTIRIAFPQQLAFSSIANSKSHLNSPKPQAVIAKATRRALNR